MSVLPTQKTEPVTQDPKNLIIYSSPKTGKTSALAQLPNNLIVDMENGTKYVSGFVTHAENYKDLYKIAKALKEEEHPYKFVTLDTVTALEDICLDLASKRYQQSTVGKNWNGTGKDILKLPSGAGYFWQREAMQEIIGWFESTGLNLILVCHVKDKMITESSGELGIRAIDLSGKTGNILSAKSDAIGFAYREPEENAVYLSFGTERTIASSARPKHLNGKKILLSKMDENGHLETFWPSIYPSLNDENNVKAS